MGQVVPSVANGHMGDVWGEVGRGAVHINSVTRAGVSFVVCLYEQS